MTYHGSNHCEPCGGTIHDHRLGCPIGFPKAEKPEEKFETDSDRDLIPMNFTFKDPKLEKQFELTTGISEKALTKEVKENPGRNKHVQEFMGGEWAYIDCGGDVRHHIEDLEATVKKQEKVITTLPDEYHLNCFKHGGEPEASAERPSAINDLFLEANVDYKSVELFTEFLREVCAYIEDIEGRKEYWRKKAIEWRDNAHLAKAHVFLRKEENNGTV